LSPHQLVRLDAYNGGNTTTTFSATCDGALTTQGTLAPGQLGTMLTGWPRNCVTVMLGSSNGWLTNFDNLVVDIVPPTATPTPTPTRTLTPTSTSVLPPGAGASCPCSIWPTNASPGSTVVGPPCELGLKLRSDQDGFITAIRFWKANGELGTDSVNLRSRT